MRYVPGCVNNSDNLSSAAILVFASGLNVAAKHRATSEVAIGFVEGMSSRKSLTDVTHTRDIRVTRSLNLDHPLGNIFHIASCSKSLRTEKIWIVLCKSSRLYYLDHIVEITWFLWQLQNILPVCCSIVNLD